jgi:superfamily I DNA/RNA helicase
MAKDILIYGPPGTGKTYKVREIVGHLVSKRMRRAEEIALCSFTRAAAYELSRRVSGMPKSNIGTLHSFAFRALNLTDDHVASAHIDQLKKVAMKKIAVPLMQMHCTHNTRYTGPG